MTQTALGGTRIRYAAAFAVAVSVAACSSQVRQGEGSSYLIMTSLQAAPGNTPGTFGSVLLSDVVTTVGGQPTFFNDLGQASVALVIAVVVITGRLLLRFRLFGDVGVGPPNDVLLHADLLVGMSSRWKHLLL